MQIRRSHSISMQDVAREAGVSPQTVSRVSNGSDAVRAATRHRVEAAMSRLGYRPNYAARALKHGRFDDIGVLMFHMASFGNMSILHGISKVAAENNYAITLLTLDDMRVPSLHQAIERMRSLPVDGAITILERKVEDFPDFTPPDGLPVVLVTEGPANHCPTIDADQYGCSITAVDYLLSRGHRTVYHIAGPKNSQAAESRLRGWHDALAQVGARVPPALIGDWEADSGYRAGLTLARDPACTAIYAANDQMAYGAIQGIIASGKRIPEDVSIIGVDDSLRGIVPNLQLTTMRLDFDAIGRRAFHMVVDACHGNPPPSGVKEVIAPQLVERRSVCEPVGTSAAEPATTRR